MANTRIGRTVSVAGSRRKATFSAWVKRTGLGESWIARFGGTYSESDFMQIGFNSADNCFIVGTSSTPRMECTRKFRDTNAWYHYVVAFDTEQSTASNRLKFYINGELITDYGTATYPTLNQDLHFNNTGSQNNAWLGGRGESSYEFNGLMSHVHWIDGTAYDASAFGSTDSTTGEWKINTSPSVTYGENGFFVLKDGSSLTDQSGEGNNFSSLVGTLTKTEDCPSNVFSTLDYLQRKTSALTYSNGNTSVSFPSAWVFALSQWGVSSGKYYWEAKCNSGNNANSFYGICAEIVPTGNGFYNNSQNGAIMYKVGSGETYIDGTNNASGYSPSINNTDIVGLALDLDSGTKTLKIYKNGVLLSSGGTINLSSHYNDTLVFPCFSGNSSSASCSFDVNFGNGYVGTTAVSSAGTNASGLGIFEYDVPAGHTALCTKGLNE